MTNHERALLLTMAEALETLCNRAQMPADGNLVRRGAHAVMEEDAVREQEAEPVLGTKAARLGSGSAAAPPAIDLTSLADGVEMYVFGSVTPPSTPRRPYDRVTKAQTEARILTRDDLRAAIIAQASNVRVL